MSEKDLVIEMIRQLPDDSTVDDIFEELFFVCRLIKV